MNEHSDLNVSYMPLFEDMSYDGEKPLWYVFVILYII